MVLKKPVREMVDRRQRVRHPANTTGEGVSAEQAAEVEALLRRENKDMEISVIDGGQPVYYYILSVE